MSRIVRARVTPVSGKAFDLEAKAALIAADTDVDTAVVVPGPGQPDTGIRHILVTSEPEATSALAKTAIDNSLTTEEMVAFEFGPLVDTDDANDDITVSIAGGADTTVFTCTDVDTDPDNAISLECTSFDGLDPDRITITEQAGSPGVFDVVIDPIAGDDGASPYSLVFTATDRAGNTGTVNFNLVVTA